LDQYRYPPRYKEIKKFVVTLQAVNHSDLEIKFNLRYVESKALIAALQYDGVIITVYSIHLKGYQVARVDSTAD